MLGAVLRWLTAFIDLPPGPAEPALAFWQAVTGSTLSPRRGERSQFVTLLPASGDAYLRAQTVLSGPGGAHLDLHSDDPAALAGRALALGAVERFREPGLVVLASPAGIGFCAVEHDGEARRPAPLVRPDGARSLVDQLCLDIPDPDYERECAFWAALTGWELRSGSWPEFRYLDRPAGMPLRLLLQRLDSGRAGAHLDLACDDAEAEAAVHTTLGATVSAPREGWITLRDPAGVPYCLTRRDPATGKLPALPDR
jgi:hypothetical protein